MTNTPQITPWTGPEQPTQPQITPWIAPEQPTQSALWHILTGEGLQPYSWSNGPFDIYAAHTHSYHKVIYVVEGNITFGLPEFGKQVTMRVGDRLDLPPGIIHHAQVGAQGVVCLEGHKESALHENVVTASR